METDSDYFKGQDMEMTHFYSNALQISDMAISSCKEGWGIWSGNPCNQISCTISTNKERKDCCTSRMLSQEFGYLIRNKTRMFVIISIFVEVLDNILQSGNKISESKRKNHHYFLKI